MVDPNGACDDPPAGHALCNLSYFEFYAPRAGVYIHKYPVASVVDQCALTSTTVPPLDATRLFGDVSAADVKSLIASLASNTPMCAAAPYAPGDFTFGFDDTVGWLLGAPRPPTSEAIAERLNALEVTACELVTGAASGAQEWRLAVTGSGGGFYAYCRRTPTPQRALDVVPLIVRAGTVWTTVSRRRRAFARIDGADVALVGCASVGRDTIVGAGEHVEATDMLCEQTDVDAPVLKVGRALKASKRALSEEVGLPGAVIDGARLWLIGHHRVPVHAAIARDVRYWPRYDAGRVLYGYRRETSTVIYAAVMRVEADVRLSPTDTGEIYTATLVPWTEVVESFRETGTRRPAFGLAHEDMVRRVEEHVDLLVNGPA
jgi:hypothetical protein